MYIYIGFLQDLQTILENFYLLKCIVKVRILKPNVMQLINKYNYNILKFVGGASYVIPNCSMTQHFKDHIKISQ